MYVMAQPSQKVFRALSAYETSMNRLNKRHPTVQASENNFQKSYEALLKTLQDERFSLPAQRIFESYDEFSVEKIVRTPEFLSIETAILNSVQGISQKEAKVVIFKVINAVRNSNDLEQINSIDLLITQVISFHSGFMEKYRASRSLEKKEKKRYRRELTASAGYFCTGMGLVAGNVYAVIIPPLATASVSIGTGAMVKGFWDMIKLL